jgi:hypothetical protein
MRQCFIAGRQSVSPETRMIRSTDRSAEKFAMSKPIRMSTPFCSKSGVKSHVAWIIDFVAKHRLPTMYVLKENVVAGGLMSYGPSIPDLYRQCASDYVISVISRAGIS